MSVIETFNMKLYDSVIGRGLCSGVGDRNGQMCIEAAICYALDLPHGDDPKCVATAVREYKIRLNDSNWSTTQARASGLRDLGIAQLGSNGVVDDAEFVKRMAEQTIRVIIPQLFREVFPDNEECLKAAAQCESEGTYAAARATDAAARAATDAAARAATDAAARAAAYAAACAAHAAAYAAAYAAARAARDAVDAAVDAAAYAAAYDAADAAAYAAACAACAARAATDDADKYLLLSASLALQVLKDMGSPGCKLLEVQS